MRLKRVFLNFVLNLFPLTSPQSAIKLALLLTQAQHIQLRQSNPLSSTIFFYKCLCSNLSCGIISQCVCDGLTFLPKPNICKLGKCPLPVLYLVQAFGLKNYALEQKASEFQISLHFYPSPIFVNNVKCPLPVLHLVQAFGYKIDSLT